MLDKLRPVFILTRREVQDQFRDWRIIFPIVGLTLFFPSLMNFTARQVVDYVSQYGAELLAERFIPFLLMIVGFFPMTVSLVIALESFAGEAERRTIEPLLSSPFTDWQLYLGKLLASVTFPLTASYLGIFTYLFGVLRSTDWQPEPGFVLLILMLTTVQALVMISAAVVISTQTTSVRAANLLSSFIVIPMALLIQGEAIIMFWGTDEVLWWVILAEVVVAILLIRMGLAHFNRENLLGREIDILNFKNNWRIFRNAFIGQARNPLQWLFREVPQSVRRLVIPIVMMCILLPVGLWIGADQAAKLNLPADILSLTNLNSLDPSIITSLEATGLLSVGGAVYIWLHNLRVVLLATLIGVFSFGVFGAIILMLPFVLIGFLTHYSSTVGMDPGIFMASFLFPHALLELPAMILAGAAIFRVGAVLVTPARNSSIGEAWLRGFADWLRIVVALVIPLFLAAAFLEAFVTPRFMLYMLGG